MFGPPMQLGYEARGESPARKHVSEIQFPCMRTQSHCLGARPIKVILRVPRLHMHSVPRWADGIRTWKSAIEMESILFFCVLAAILSIAVGRYGTKDFNDRGIIYM